MAGYTIAVGQTHPYWTLEWWSVNQDTGKRELKDFTGLTASNFTLILHPVSNAVNGGADITGTGAFVLVSNPGWLQYQPSASDVALPGTYQCYVTANFNGLLDVSQPFTLTIGAK